MSNKKTLFDWHESSALYNALCNGKPRYTCVPEMPGPHGPFLVDVFWGHSTVCLRYDPNDIHQPDYDDPAVYDAALEAIEAEPMSWCFQVGYEQYPEEGRGGMATLDEAKEEARKGWSEYTGIYDDEEDGGLMNISTYSWDDLVDDVDECELADHILGQRETIGTLEAEVAALKAELAKRGFKGMPVEKIKEYESLCSIPKDARTSKQCKRLRSLAKDIGDVISTGDGNSITAALAELRIDLGLRPHGAGTVEFEWVRNLNNKTSEEYHAKSGKHHLQLINYGPHCVFHIEDGSGEYLSRLMNHVKTEAAQRAAEAAYLAVKAQEPPEAP